MRYCLVHLELIPACHVYRLGSSGLFRYFYGNSGAKGLNPTHLLTYCLSVSLLRSDHEPYKNGRTDQDAVWITDSDEPKNHVLDRHPDPHAQGQFL